MKLFKNFQKLSLKIKLELFVGFFVLISSITVGSVSYFMAQDEIIEGYEAKIITLLENKAEIVKQVLNKFESEAKTMASSKFVQDALVAFESMVYSAGIDITSDSDLYSSPYYKAIKDKSSDSFEEYTKNFAINEFWIVLNSGVVVAQGNGHNYIGMNLQMGKLDGTAMSKCFQNAIKDKDGFAFEDVSLREKKTVAYGCQRIFSKYDRDGYEKNAAMGVLINELNWKEIQKIVSSGVGLNETGSFNIFSADKLFRANPRFHKEGWTFEGSLESSLPYEGDLVTKFSGEFKGLDKIERGYGTNYLGFPSFGAGVMINVYGTHWILEAEIQTQEMFRTLVKMRWYLLGSLVISILIIVFLSNIFSSQISKTFVQGIEVLSKEVNEIEQVVQVVLGSSQKIADASTHQTAAIHETTAALDEMAAMVKRTAEMATETMAAVTQNLNETSHGQEEMGLMVSNILAIRSSNDSLVQQSLINNEKLHKIVEMISDISQKTLIINEIAFQTKLLSFNASVEAARAGEHGKGFAVVAEEVGNLAQVSASAANDINALVADGLENVKMVMAQTVKEIQNLTKESTACISKGELSAQECQLIFEKVYNGVAEITSKSGIILKASEEQSVGVNQIEKAMLELDKETSVNAQTAQNTKETARQLHQMVVVLTEVRNKIKKMVEGDQKDAA